jgi:2-amino-4-hydroxy-6-hydroxymethyldihydropteridine diphosphokinase
MSRDMEYGLSLGSNEGDRLSNLRLTTEKIRHIDNVSVADQSAIYETEPVDVASKHQNIVFLNCVIIIKTSLAPNELLKELQNLEIDMGRPKDHEHNAPRPIDIDIIYAENTTVETERITIPHPLWAERRFVVEPLANLRPDLILPGKNKTISEILTSLPENPKVCMYKT